MENTLYTVGGKEFELKHYGVKGMKWGVRKKKYAKGASMDANDPSDSKTTRRVKNDYNTMSDFEFRKKYQTSKETYRKRVNRYGDPYMRSPLAKAGKKLAKSKTLNKIADSDTQKKRTDKLVNKLTGNKAKKVLRKGAEATARALSKVGQAYVTDQLFFGGMGTKIAKETVKAMGMATITAYTMARGGYDIKWYDKQGRRVG